MDGGTWERAAVVWVNYPNNPTTATAPLDFLCRLADLARAYDFYLCSDKCDKNYEACMRRRTGKGHEDCPGDVLKCRDKCSPQWRQISKQAAAIRRRW